MVNKYNAPEIGTFIIETFKGCQFVGISSDNEVYIRFEDCDPVKESIVKKGLREEFPDLSKITTVVEPSINQVKEMVDKLNHILEEEDRGKTNLLDIEEF